MTLLIGIPACTRAIRGHPQHATPARYGAEEDATPGLHDPARDTTTLPLIREALRRGMPLLAVCRDIQGVNVAPGRLDHRGGPGPRSRATRRSTRLRCRASLRGCWAMGGSGELGARPGDQPLGG